MRRILPVISDALLIAAMALFYVGLPELATASMALALVSFAVESRR